jgi:hypothetical protein
MTSADGFVLTEWGEWSAATVLPAVIVAEQERKLLDGDIEADDQLAPVIRMAADREAIGLDVGVVEIEVGADAVREVSDAAVSGREAVGLVPLSVTLEPNHGRLDRAWQCLSDAREDEREAECKESKPHQP